MSFNWCIVMLYTCAVWCFNFVIYLYGISNYFSDWACREYDEVQKEYDYIIVGGGSSGATLASLLSATGAQVLLLEAGMEASSYMLDIPVIAPLLQLSEFDWQYKTEPQREACLALHNNMSSWPMGRLLGGTSRLNSLLYLRGHSQDFDEWAAGGCTGWSYQDVVPYFEAVEKGKSKIAVASVEWATPLIDAFLAAGEMLGFAVRDLNGPEQTGFMRAAVNVRRGSRWSSDQLLSGKPHLQVSTNSIVEKVLLKDGYEAYGVRYRKFGKAKKARAHKGVVLSAGVVGTPKILMLSGIGPAAHLSKHGVPVIQDLAVGQNLQDHVTTGLDLVLLNQSLPLSLASVASPLSFLSYVLHGEGPWSFPGCEGVAVVHTGLSKAGVEPPNLGLMLLPTGISGDAGVHLRKAVGVSDKVWSEYFAPLEGQSVASVLPILLHPRSRGEVLLRSRNPNDAPIIRAKYLDDPHDVETLLQGIQLVKELVKTTSMQRFGARLNEKPLPGCETLQFDSVEYWECYIRHLTLTSFHPVGTCKMGDTSDRTTVVDSNLRVRGLHKLFVVDASVIPSLPSANIQATVLMVAHKGAELLQAHWKELHGSCHRRMWFEPW